MARVRSQRQSWKALHRRLESGLETVRAAARQTMAQARRAPRHSSQASQATNTAIITNMGKPGSTQAVSSQQSVDIQQHGEPEGEQS